MVEASRPTTFGLRLVALFEAGKGLLVLLVGMELLSLIHQGVQNIGEEIVERFHLTLPATTHAFCSTRPPTSIILTFACSPWRRWHIQPLVLLKLMACGVYVRGLSGLQSYREEFICRSSYTNWCCIRRSSKPQYWL